MCLAMHSKQLKVKLAYSASNYGWLHFIFVNHITPVCWLVLGYVIYVEFSFIVDLITKLIYITIWQSNAVML